MSWDGYTCSLYGKTAYFSSSVSSSTLKAPNLSIWAIWGAKEWQDFAWDEESFFFFLFSFSAASKRSSTYYNIIHNKTDRTIVNGRKWVIRETAAIPIKIIKLWHCMFFTAGHRLAVNLQFCPVLKIQCIGVDYRVLI